jgi:hypothetical protein
VTKIDSSLARNTTSGAISSACASRPMGWRAMKALRASSGSALALMRSLQRWRVDRARAHRIAADALGHVVGGHALGEAEHRGLGGAVDEAVGQALDAAAHAGHVDDAAAPGLQHAGQHGLDGPELRAHVEVEGEGQVVVGRLLDGAVVHEARAVEEHVERGQLSRTSAPMAALSSTSSFTAVTFATPA